ncbi:MAG: hypothetical protein JNK05_00580 [Myxococcales bacterium]|nr:hypothetical protein [Myxococcales bacterium]
MRSLKLTAFLSTASLISCGARSELLTPLAFGSTEDAGRMTPEDTTGRVVPVRILAHTDAHFAVMSDGTVRMWGHSAVPGLIDPARPTELPGVRDIIAVSGEVGSIDYVTSSGDLFRVRPGGTGFPGNRVVGVPPLRDFNRRDSVVRAWLTRDGRAMYRDSVFVDEFREVAAPVRFRSIGGTGRGLAAGEDGLLYEWGGNLTASRVTVPFRVREVASECILSDEGELACRGEGFGADGIPAEGAFVAAFTRMPGARGIVQFANGLDNTLMLRSDGVFLRTGVIRPGGCFRHPDADLWRPNIARVAVGIRDVVSFSHSLGAFCLLFRNHEVSCCGRVSGGSLGDGRTLESEEWIRVAFE